MALAEVVAAAPDSAHHSSEQLRTSSGSFKGDMPQENHVLEGRIGNSAQLKRLDGAVDGGYNIPVLASFEGGMGCDSRHVYTNMLSENGQSMYYVPGYDFSQQSSYCSQPQGPYISSVGLEGAGYCGPQYGPYYQQLSPALIQQYFPTEQEVSKSGSKKPSAKDSAQNTKPKSKPGVQGKLGQQGGCDNSLQSDAPNHWGFYPGAASGGFYGSSMGFDCYIPQQWQSSARGFQPVPPPQNNGAHGNCTPPLPGVGHEHYLNFARVYSTSTMPGRVIKGCSVKGGATGGNWRAKEIIKSQGKGESPSNGLLEACVEQTQKLSFKPKVPPGAVQEIGDMPPPMYENLISSVTRSDYNKEDFQTTYEAAKFFIIKSYSEDDVHKSIKYSVWSSTPNGNKRLDEAYRKAQENPESLSGYSCPVFFFFSVNCSGQFCGVAEMVGTVDFGKNMDFWLQGKWNGCLPVKWHIIKDVPNGHFRHIILTNNDNKPVTHSRDTQEVHFHQGLEMLQIFKYFPIRTSLLDDFTFYDQRQRILQERKSKQQLRQQVVKQMKEKASEKMNSVGDASSDYVKENGKPVKPAERLNIGSALPSTDSKEVARSVESDMEKREVVSTLLKVTDIKLVEKAEQQESAETAVDSLKDTTTKVAPAEMDKVCKSKVSKDTCIGKEPSNCIEKETSNKLDLIGNGVDKNSTPEVADADTSATNGKDDASRLVINYKKALLEGKQGKVIVLDQTMGS